MTLAGKRILVTGSTRGIGKPAAEELAAKGASVILHGRNEEAVASAVSLFSAQGWKATGIAADLSSRHDIARLAQEAGDIDALVNVAGIYEEECLDQVTSESWARTMDVNLTAPWLLAKQLLPGLRNSRGVIINVASDAGFIGIAGGSTYCASKGALIGLTKALAVELAPDVRALCICPGPVATNMMANSLAASPDPEATRAQWENYALLKRVAEPSEIASFIAYAASDEAGFATGAVWLMDGGVTAGRRP
jgi:NAD(P)-dependent dehydrogenase (short-subunit alcohol dehydrogenase family)